MAVPSFEVFLRPVLASLGSDRSTDARSVIESVSTQLGLMPSDLVERTSGGRRTKVEDRVAWSLTYLAQAGLLNRPQRGRYQLNEQGTAFLQRYDKIGLRESMTIPSFAEFQIRSRGAEPDPSPDPSPKPGSSPIVAPIEALEAAFREIVEALSEELLSRVKSMEPEAFERLIVQLMLRMGYGGSMEDAGRTLGRSGDGGVDGVIKQDRLGLENVYLQAKRWRDETVGRKELQAFVGALAGQSATKGVFITTSEFTKEAIEYSRTAMNARISLVDGRQLTKLMIEHDLGVSPIARYEVKRVDSDFFDQF